MIGVLLVLMLLQYLTRSFIRKGLKKWLEKTETYWDDIFYKSEFFTQEYSALNPNDMIRLGDWVEMPEYNADGEIFDISVHTVKVSNWDKTISTIPIDALMANSFKNWRGMEMAGGRWINRALYIDLNSIRFCDKPLLEHLSKINYIPYYITEKQEETIRENLSHHPDPSDVFACHNNTNFRPFRAYIFGYLKDYPKINNDMRNLVRHMAPLIRVSP